MRLWIVPVEYRVDFEMAVVAESEEDARRIAADSADEERGNLLYGYDEPDVLAPRAVESPDAIPEDLRGSIPWSEDGEDRTVERWLEEYEPPPPTDRELEDAGQINAFGGVA